MKKFVYILPLAALLLACNNNGPRHYLETYDHVTSYLNGKLKLKGDYKYNSNHDVTVYADTTYDPDTGAVLYDSVMSISYNDHNDPTKSLYKVGGTTYVNESCAYVYDESNRIQSCEIDLVSVISYHRLEKYYYDELSRITKLETYDVSGDQPDLIAEDRYTYKDKFTDYETYEHYMVNAGTYTLHDKEINSFNDEGYVIKKDVYEYSELDHTLEYRYDEYGCLLSTLETTQGISFYIYTANYYKNNPNKPSYEFTAAVDGDTTTKIIEYDEYDRIKDEYIYSVDDGETHNVYTYDSLIWE